MHNWAKRKKKKIWHANKVIIIQSFEGSVAETDEVKKHDHDVPDIWQTNVNKLAMHHGGAEPVKRFKCFRIIIVVSHLFSFTSSLAEKDKHNYLSKPGAAVSSLDFNIWCLPPITYIL